MVYTIQRGDTLSALAKKYNTTVGELARLNNIKDPNKIYAGRTLTLPDAPGAAREAGGTGTSGTSAGGTGGGIGFSGAGEALPRRSGSAQSRPGEYESDYAAQIARLLEEMEGREAFAYDYNDDPVYRQYRDAYMREGEKAMRDAMGSAAALTGGYGSSYATTAGQQAYQEYLGALNDKIPQLTQTAYDRYREGEQALYDKLDLYAGLDERGYSRYRDGVADWEAERDYALELDALELDKYLADREYEYQLGRDRQEQSNWERSYAAKAAASGSGSGKSGADASGTDRAQEIAGVYEVWETLTPQERRLLYTDARYADYRAYLKALMGAEGMQKLWDSFQAPGGARR